MATEQTNRPKFYEGQYLSAADLTAVVQYGQTQRSRHFLGAHTWGIAMGLELKERPSPAGGDIVDVFIQPGYAWDGFGRPLVILSPTPVPAEKFKSYVYNGAIDEGNPQGRMFEVWVCYNESPHKGPLPGFESCEGEDQLSQIEEVFLIEVGERRNHADRHDTVSVAGRSVDAQEALQMLGSGDPLVYDESIPYQLFPEGGGSERWLIPLGYVRWKPSPDPNQPGHFVEMNADDQKQSRNIRQYIGLIAEGIQSASGIIRMRDRTADPSTAPRTDDLVWVEGNLRVDNDLKVIKRTGIGTMSPARRMEIKREGNDTEFSINENLFLDGAGQTVRITNNAYIENNSWTIKDTAKKAFTLEIRDSGMLELYGTKTDGDTDWNKMATFDAPNDRVVFPSGNVGIGNTSPGAKLEVNGDIKTHVALISDNPHGTNYAAFSHKDQGTSGGYALLQHKNGETYLNAPDGKNINIRINNSTKMRVLSNGNVGIGTTSPTGKFDVFTGGASGAHLTMGGHAITLKGVNDPVAYNPRLPYIQWKQANNMRAMYLGWGDTNSKFVDMKLENGFDLAIRGGNVGIGTAGPSAKLHVKDSKNADASSVSAHIALIENESAGNNADVLALKIGRSAPQGGNNYISFFAGNNIVGSLEGKSSGPTGIRLKSGSGDFAEYLPRLNSEEKLEAGDIVGVLAGKITRNTVKAHYFTAITNRSIVLGNMPQKKEDEKLYEEVAFMGQVSIKVRGQVNAGNFIVPSGLNDGTGIAVSAREMNTNQFAQIVGQAWESSHEKGLKLINTAVGLHFNNSYLCEMLERLTDHRRKKEIT